MVTVKQQKTTECRKKDILKEWMTEIEVLKLRSLTENVCTTLRRVKENPYKVFVQKGPMVPLMYPRMEPLS